MYDAYRADLQTQEVGGNPGRVDSMSQKNGNQGGNYIRQGNTHSSL